jgi:hypothetical protein
VYRHEHVAGTTDTVGDFRVAFDDNRGAVAMWVHGTNQGREIVAARYLNGAWQAPATVARLGTAEVLLGTLAAKNGAVALAFTSTHEGEARAYVVTAPVGQPWSAPMAVSAPGHDVALGERDRSVAVGTDGRIAAVWTQTVANRDHVVVRIYTPGVGWKQPRDLGPGGSQGPVQVFMVQGGFAFGWVEGGDIVDGEVTPASVRGAVYR